MITHTEKVKRMSSNLSNTCELVPDKEHIVTLSSPVENLLKTWSLLWTETTAYAVLIRTTAGGHLGGCQEITFSNND